MRNIAEIIKDDRNGKQLSQIERQIAVAYIQGKYDAVMQLLEQESVIDKIRNEIDLETRIQVKHYTNTDNVIDAVLDVIDEYKAESEE